MTSLRALCALLASGGTLYMGADWLIAVGVGGMVAYWMRPQGPARILFELDTTTGQMKAQPYDKVTEEYFRKRG